MSILVHTITVRDAFFVIPIILIGCSSFAISLYRANMTMIHMYMVSIICIKNINMHYSVYYMCLRRIYIYVFIFIFPIVHNFAQIKRKKCKFIITCKIHQSGLWESRSYRNITCYHYLLPLPVTITNHRPKSVILRKSKNNYSEANNYSSSTYSLINIK